MFIAVDIGNTSIKLGCFAATQSAWPQPLQTFSFSTRDINAWEALTNLPEGKASWFVGSVHREAETQLAKWVAHHRPQDSYRLLDHSTMPIAIHVDFPERVGSDRLLAAVAVNQLREPHRPAVVIDAGTAVTIDLVSADGAFEGGVIWPGWRMMAQSLAGNTDALPLVTAALSDGPPEILGKSTDKAIRSALFWGNVGAVREIVARLRQTQTTEPQVFVTGGDAQRLAHYACPEAQSVEELVLCGTILAARALS